MKKIVFAVILSLFVTGINAQPEFDLGLKAGLNNSKISNNLEDFTSESIIAWHLGVYTRLGLNRFYLQPEAYFSSKGGDLKEVLSHSIASFNYNTFDMPVLAGYKILDKESFNLRVMAGPVFSFITSGEVSREDLFDADFYRNNFFGWQYGLGADLYFVTFDARIENSSNRIYSSPNLKSRNNTFFVTVGIRIL